MRIRNSSVYIFFFLRLVIFTRTLIQTLSDDSYGCPIFPKEN